MFVRAALRCVRLSFLPFFVSLLHEARCERRVCVLSLSVSLSPSLCVCTSDPCVSVSLCLCLSPSLSLARSLPVEEKARLLPDERDRLPRLPPPAPGGHLLLRGSSRWSPFSRADQAKEATGRLKDHFVNVVDDEAVAHVDRRVLLTRGSLSPSLSLSFPRSRARTHGKKPSPSSCQRESLTSTAVA